jgi:hypothetical protein
MIELQEKIKKEFNNISDEESKVLASVVHKHYHFIIENHEFEDYELSTEKMTVVLKI